MTTKRKHEPSTESSSERETRNDDAISINWSDDEFLKKLDTKLNDEERVDESIAASLAKVANKSFKKKMSDEKFKGKLDKYLKLDNCEQLRVPTVNSEIWKRLPSQAKESDLKTAKVQRTIVKAAMAMVRSTQSVLRASQKGKASLDSKSITDMNADTLAFLGHASMELSYRHRLAPRPHLSKNIAGLCSEAVPHYWPAFWRQFGRFIERATKN